jgi:hypothetical protein
MMNLEPGQRVKLVHTDDEWTRLRPGSLGTVVAIRPDYSNPREFVLDVDWDDGSNLSLLSAAGDRVEPA